MLVWKNPWTDAAIPVDIESLADEYNKYIQSRGGMGDGKGNKIPNYDILEDSWKKNSKGEPMDAYFLKYCPSEEYVIFGVRFSDEESDYYGGEIPREYAERVKRLGEEFTNEYTCPTCKDRASCDVGNGYRQCRCGEEFTA